MRNDQNCWKLAELLIEQHGPEAQTRARLVEEVLNPLAAAGERIPVADTVRAMQVFLAVENPTIH